MFDNLHVIEFLVSKGANILALKGAAHYSDENYNFALRCKRVCQFAEKYKLKRIERGKKALYRLIIQFLIDFIQNLYTHSQFKIIINCFHKTIIFVL